MNAFLHIKEIFPKMIGFKLAYYGWLLPPTPITLTFSITNRCQSRCLTCQIWRIYLNNPDLEGEELTLGEIKKIFQNLGHIYFFNISGGEPFLRQDLPQIVSYAIKYLSPRIIHIPTNALAPSLVEGRTIQILEIMKRLRWQVPLTVKPSLDGIGEKHDQIRGVKGNFAKVMDVIARLKRIQKSYPNLHLELGTVISKFNIGEVKAIVDFVHNLDVESYRHEIAEQRAELFNIGNPITPSYEEYMQLIKYFSQKIRENISTKRWLAKVTEALRLVYYEYAAHTLLKKRQVLPCLAGISNVHINPYGQVWPCCVLGYEKPMGDLRQANYNFQRIWYSEQASTVRAYIKGKNCTCPLANQAYSNILADLCATMKVILNIIRFS
jgi:MoaA/NifB/PqqE/SkfB family radical SAM enzyme